MAKVLEIFFRCFSHHTFETSLPTLTSTIITLPASVAIFLLYFNLPVNPLSVLRSVSSSPLNFGLLGHILAFLVTTTFIAWRVLWLLCLLMTCTDQPNCFSCISCLVAATNLICLTCFLKLRLLVFVFFDHGSRYRAIHYICYKKVDPTVARDQC